MREFEEYEGSDDGCLCDVVRMNWNLVICFHQIQCGEDFPTSELLCSLSIGQIKNGCQHPMKLHGRHREGA